jgi:predicted metalloprotease with PDZ domain
VSSLGPEAAVLMPGDLLPRLCAGDADCESGNAAVRLRVTPPPDWQLASAAKRLPRNGPGELLDLPDPGRAVLFLGRLARRTIPAINSNGMTIEIATAGAWEFKSDEVFQLAEAIAREQAAMMQGRETGDFLVTLAPFPQPMTGLRSSGVAIGRTVVLMLNPDADPQRTMAHYRKHLAHEMFHFYLPNAFQIRENFDWFWEGFTRYLAVLTLARLQMMSPREYLAAVAAEYEAYFSNPLRTRVSLIEASPEKFAGAANYDLVYRKGMLLAALYDWELRWQTRNRATLPAVVAALYQRHAGGTVPLGNREVLAALGQPGNFARLIRDEIEGVADIDLEKRLKPYGLLVEWSAASRWKLRLSPAPNLSERQRALWEGVAGR